MLAIFGTFMEAFESIETGGSIIVSLLSSTILASATGCRLKRYLLLFSAYLPCVSASDSKPIGVVLECFLTNSRAPEVSQSVFG